MGIAVLGLILVIGTVVLFNKVAGGFVCPFCDGEIRREFQVMECTACGRRFPMWQARRRKPRP